MSKEPKRNVYVGHRYVPKIMGEWDKTETYEGLSIVTNKGTSYTSKKRVPVGIDILDEEYWVVTGNYNAQIEEYRKDVRSVKSDMIDLEESVNKDLKENKEYINTELTKTNNKITKVSNDLTNVENTLEKTPLSIIDPYEETITKKMSLFEKEKEIKEFQKTMEEKNQLRIATFNIGSYTIKYLDYLNETLDFVRDTKAHVIGCQEVSQNNYLNFERDFKTNLYNNNFFSENVNKNENFKGYNYGLGSIGTLPFLTKQSVKYNMLNPDEYEQRGYQKMEIILNEQRVSIYNTHLTHNNMPELSNQVDQLYDRVLSDSNKYKIIVGDFNTTQYEYFSEFENNGYTLANRDQFPTFKSSGKGIDEIMVSPNIDILNAEIMDTKHLSDHNLFFTDLQLN